MFVTPNGLVHFHHKLYKNGTKIYVNGAFPPVTVDPVAKGKNKTSPKGESSLAGDSQYTNTLNKKILLLKTRILKVKIRMMEICHQKCIFYIFRETNESQ